MVNNPEVKGNEMVLNMSDYVRLKEVQYLLAVSYTHLDVYKRQGYRLV